MSQAGQEAAFHIDHIIPRRAGGKTTPSNLALSCVSCSLRKGAALTAADIESGDVAPIFNPRMQVWEEHFRLIESFEILGLTPVGRATAARLAMNRPLAIEIRREQASR